MLVMLVMLVWLMETSCLEGRRQQADSEVEKGRRDMIRQIA